MSRRMLPEQRRLQIIQTAMELLAEQRYEDVSLQQIIEAAGVYKGGFYHHFRSKDELMAAAARYLAEQFLGTVAGVLKREDLTAVEKLNELFRSVNQQKREESAMVMALMLRIYADGKNVLLEDQVFSESKQILLPILQSVVAEGVAEGSMAPSHPDDAAELFVDLFVMVQRDASERLMRALQSQDAAALDRLKHRYSLVEQLTENLFGLKPGVLRVAEVAAATIDAMAAAYVGRQ